MSLRMLSQTINTANGCDEVGTGDANIEFLNYAKWMYVVKNCLVHFTTGDDIFEKSWKERIRELVLVVRPSSPSDCQADVYNAASSDHDSDMCD